METVRIIKAFHPSVPLVEEADLSEMDLGEFDGMKAQQWAEQYQNFRKAWHETPATIKMPGGESLQEVQVRVVEAIKRITRIYPPKSTLLISAHNFVNLTILCYAFGRPLDRFRDFKQGTAALNILYMNGEKLRADVVNDQEHLKKYKNIKGY